MPSGSVAKAIVPCLRLASAVLLGLPVTLLAHGLRYGADHSAASVYHAHFVQGALAAGTCLLFALSFSAARSAWAGWAHKLVLERVERLLPGWCALALSSVAWFVLVERLDDHPHGMPVSALLAIAIVAFVLRASSRAFCRALTCVAVAVLSYRVSPDIAGRLNGEHALGLLVASEFRFRLFARPPPIFA